MVRRPDGAMEMSCRGIHIYEETCSSVKTIGGQPHRGNARDLVDLYLKTHRGATVRADGDHQRLRLGTTNILMARMRSSISRRSAFTTSFVTECGVIGSRRPAAETPR